MCLQLTKQNPEKNKAFLYLLLAIHIQKNVLIYLKIIRILKVEVDFCTFVVKKQGINRLKG